MGRGREREGKRERKRERGARDRQTDREGARERSERQTEEISQSQLNNFLFPCALWEIKDGSDDMTGSEDICC